MRKALAWALGALSCRADCLEEHCLATSQDAGTSWVQMKISKLENSKATPGTDEFGNFYSKRGGDLLGSNTISWDMPQDFSNPAWTWNNELDEQIRHSPLIDGKKNIYVAGTLRLRKFSPEGKLLWLFNQDEPGHTSPVLGDGLVYFRVGCGNGHSRVYALDMGTGKVVINKTVAGFDYGADSPSLLLTKNRLFVPVTARSLGGGCDSVLAMNASTGDLLWSYTTDDVMWNMAPTTPDGGESITFSSSCGVFHRISAAEGQLMVKSADKIGIDGVCGTGGGTAGPNGLFYSAHGLPQAGQSAGFMQPGLDMFITAYNITTGEIAWRFQLEKPYDSPQSPAVGYLYEGGPLAVVAAIGQNTALPPLILDEAEMGHYLADADLRHKLNVTALKNSVIALDAATGAKIWRWDEADWDHLGAAGDEEGFPRRAMLGSVENPVCLPDNQGIPLISTKMGVVIASSSHSGNMTLIRDANKNGIIEDGETTAFAPGVAFLNGPSSAPDMLVASPCWGPMYVFRQ